MFPAEKNIQACHFQNFNHLRSLTNPNPLKLSKVQASLSISTSDTVTNGQTRNRTWKRRVESICFLSTNIHTLIDSYVVMCKRTLGEQKNGRIFECLNNLSKFNTKDSCSIRVNKPNWSRFWYFVAFFYRPAHQHTGGPAKSQQHTRTYVCLVSWSQRQTANGQTCINVCRL